MPAPKKLWRHVIISTYCSWLKGDPRGFRTRGHEIHSSGDYKNPPPVGEHEGLHRYFVDRAAEEVHIDYGSRAAVGRAVVQFFRENGHPITAVAVAKVHAHVLVELMNDLAQIRMIVGEAKRFSSRAVKREMPGKVWARGGKWAPVWTTDHFEKAREYVLYDQGADAWTWSCEDESLEGTYARCRPALRSGRP